MNRLRLFALISLILGIVIVSSCFNMTANKNSQTSRTPDSTTTTAASPSPASQTSSSKSGDFSQALNDYNAKNYEKAVTGFQEAVKADPKNSTAHYYLGKSYQALKKDDEAIPAFKEAIRIKPDYAEANFSLGNIYYGRKSYDTSLPYLDQAAKTNYKSAEMLMALGDNQRMLKQFNKAIVQYGKVIGFEPENANAYYALGLTYIGLNNKIGARQQVRKLDELDKTLAKKLTDQIGS